jgi:formyltetrahydrofolate deformylase
LDKGLQEIRTKFALLKAQVDWFQDRKRVAVMVSKQDHCLWELLLRHEAQELNCDIPIVISNHQDCRDVAETFNIPYHVFEITAENKVLQEAHQLDLLKELKIDVVVLARYMQVLTSQFLQTYPECIINIHHSFLPAFSGSRAYHKAHERGVKLIGATAHYATEELDEGPIITQDVIDVTHRDQARDYIRKGRILERTVLVNAVQAHLENRILVYNNKCVVFSE